MKYIIELEDKPVRDLYGENENYYKCKQMPYWYLPESLVNRLTPYTDPDREAIENEGWSFAWKIFNMDMGEYEEMFDGKECPSDYREAKVKYEAWKKEKEKLRVGDEVIYHRNKYIVGYVGEDEVYHLVDQCWIRVVVQGDYQLTKTGRHFPEVTELLKKMRGELNHENKL